MDWRGRPRQLRRGRAQPSPRRARERSEVPGHQGWTPVRDETPRLGALRDSPSLAGCSGITGKHGPADPVHDMLRAVQKQGNRETGKQGMPAAIRRSRPHVFQPSTVLNEFGIEGYSHLTSLATGVCGIKRFNFTTALVVGIFSGGYERRYCYEHAAGAIEGLQGWNGVGHPSGPWIKCKGSGVDLLNPDL